MPPELKARLQEYFARDIEKLQRILERDFSYWLEPTMMKD